MGARLAERYLGESNILKNAMEETYDTRTRMSTMPGMTSKKGKPRKPADYTHLMELGGTFKGSREEPSQPTHHLEQLK